MHSFQNKKEHLGFTEGQSAHTRQYEISSGERTVKHGTTLTALLLALSMPLTLGGESCPYHLQHIFPGHCCDTAACHASCRSQGTCSEKFKSHQK